MKHFALFALVAVAFLFAGCASVVSGTDQKLTFNSEPDEATITVSGRVLGKTPLTVPVDRASNQSITFEKEGYKTYTAQLSTSTNPWFFGNIVLGGLLGSTTDGASGAIHEFSPDQYFVTLNPDTPTGISTSKPRQIKEIIIAFSGELRHQLATGGGEKLDALLQLLDIDLSEKDTTSRALNQLALSNENDLELANTIIEVYGVQ
ncbi:PEGA domain-containing protein [Marinobacter sp. LV10R520-4]|uniref:PEGA domain-containing protein n=1 Tax=Marinobacter sp. LV10R520-4 TaxID=1761796 RepID=UPI000BF7F433|nr:PEGA domain-containing protein [Marinobacter sp. LV10R520-4]PFG53364.1 PEGA domain-containing protein [Marinobacter sp. LV10R520-4]